MEAVLISLTVPVAALIGVLLGWRLWAPPKHDEQAVIQETLRQELLQSSLEIFKRGLQNDNDPFFMSSELCTRKDGLKPFVDRFNSAYRGSSECCSGGRSFRVNSTRTHADLVDPIVKAMIKRDEAANDALLALSCDLSRDPEDAPIRKTPLFGKALQTWREAYEEWAQLVKEANKR